MVECRRLIFTVSEGAKSFVSDFLLGLDSMGVAEDIVEERGIVEVSAYFSGETDLGTVIEDLKDYISFLEKNLLFVSLGDIAVEEIDPSAWEVWGHFLKTVRVSGRVVVRPPWEEYLPRGDEIVIEINPSMAFGTGHHETTRLCIQAMEEIMQENKVRSVLDVGCGSGILAISSVKLGADFALGLDADLIAVREAKKNLERNSVSDRVRLFCGHTESVKSKFDLIVVNISAEVVLDSGEQIRCKLNKSGKLVASGIHCSNRDGVASGLERLGFKLNGQMMDGEWVVLVFDVDKSHI